MTSGRFAESATAEAWLASQAASLLAFNVICSVGIVLNVLLLNVLFNYAHVNRYVANGIAILIVTGWNSWPQFSG